MTLAYFDPGPGSLLVQAIAAGSAGLVVLLRFLWQSYRARRAGISSYLAPLQPSQNPGEEPFPPTLSMPADEQKSDAICCDPAGSSDSHPCLQC
jgi:hypothetical protein